MDEAAAVQAVKIIQPKLVIPCHYNCAGLFSKSLNPSDDQLFKHEVEKMGAKCTILDAGGSLDLSDE